MKITTEQKNLLLEFIEGNENVCKSKISIKFTARDLQASWQEVTRKLNSCQGPNKTWKEWRKSWQDIKSITKGKALAREGGSTGGGPTILKELNDFQKRVIGIIGKNAVCGHSGIVESKIILDAEPQQYPNDAFDPDYSNSYPPSPQSILTISEAIPQTSPLIPSPTSLFNPFHSELIPQTSQSIYYSSSPIPSSSHSISTPIPQPSQSIPSCSKSIPPSSQTTPSFQKLIPPTDSRSIQNPRKQLRFPKDSTSIGPQTQCRKRARGNNERENFFMNIQKEMLKIKKESLEIKKKKLEEMKIFNERIVELEREKLSELKKMNNNLELIKSLYD